VAQVAGKEGHLVDAHHHHALRAGDQPGNRLDLLQLQPPRALVQIDEVGRKRGLELTVTEGQKRGLRAVAGRAPGRMRAPLVLVPRRLLEFRKPVEAECLGEPHNGGAAGVRPPGKLLGRLERRLFEVVHDVASHVLLGT
jgi:hypothetical protein